MKSIIVLVCACACLGIGHAEPYVTVQSRNVSNDLAVSTVSFGTIFITKNVVAQQYVEVACLSTQTYWSLSIYSNNTNASSGLIQKAGLISDTSNTCRAPMLWRVFATAQGNTVTYTDTTNWGWLKDKSDSDDPDTSAINESWQTAYDGGYTDVCTGSPSGIVLGSFPSSGRAGGSPVYVYLAADFNSAPSGKYSTTIWFDLVNSGMRQDVNPPQIVHAPVTKIEMLGNKMIVDIEVIDDYQVTGANLCYRVKGCNAPYTVVPIPLTINERLAHSGFVELAPNLITKSGIEYYLTATDGVNTASYSNTGYASVCSGNEAPLAVPVTQQCTVAVSAAKGGRIALVDGNSDDGETSVTLRAGALSKDTNITITQVDPADVPDAPFGTCAALTRKPVAVYRFDPDGTEFRRSADLSLLYLDLDNDGNVELQDGTKTDTNEEKLAIFWWDGFVWRLVGGKVDPKLNTISARVGHFTYYAVFPAKPFTADDYRPKRNIITPATKDGKNDREFIDGLGNEYEIKIFDVSGRLVTTINQDNSPGANWGGTDDLGNIVESGVYIYQFKAPVDGVMKLISGTIVVAK